MRLNQLQLSLSDRQLPLRKQLITRRYNSWVKCHFAGNLIQSYISEIKMAVKFSGFSHQAYYCRISDMKTEVTFSAVDRRTPNSVTNVKKDHGKCHNLEPMYEDKTPDPTWRVWKFRMTACRPATYLHGPACLREGRGLIYPCERKKCVIRCPCNVCAGVVHQESGHSRQDRFDIHQQYHSAPHLNCIFCAEMMRIIPGLCFLKVITVRESGKSISIASY